MSRLRPHGTRAKYVVEHCHCDACRAANTAYANQRSRRLIREATGSPSVWVDAEPVREHIRALSAAGLGARRVAIIACLERSVLDKLMHGIPSAGRPPNRRVRRDTAEKLLAVRADERNLAGRQHVDATGTTRRLQALMAVGWSRAYLAQRLGTSAANLHTRMSLDRVWAHTARTVRALYDELWDQPPPTDTHSRRVSVARTKANAAKAGWAPPAAWDDDEIDDPAARPHLGKQGSTVLDLAEVDHLADGGVALDEIARRTGVAVDSIKTARWRATGRWSERAS